MFFDAGHALDALPELGARTRALLERLLPGGVTLLLPNPRARFPLACGADPHTLGLRVPATSVLAGVRIPVLQSSANLSGGPDAAAARRRPRRDPGAGGPARGRGRAAGDAVDRHRPPPLRGCGGVGGRAGGRRGARRGGERGGGDSVESRTRRAPPALPSRRRGAARRPRGRSGRGAGCPARAVVSWRSPPVRAPPTPSSSTGERAPPFRLVRSDGRTAASLGAFGVPGAEYADIAAGAAGPLVVFARPTSHRLRLRVHGLRRLGSARRGDRRAGARARRHDADRGLPGRRRGRRALARRIHNGAHPTPAPRCATRRSMRRQRRQPARAHPRAVAQPARSCACSGPVRRPPRSPRSAGCASLEASIARDGERVFVAYRDGARRLVLASAVPSAGARWSRRRLRVRGALNGAPAIARVGRRTLVASSQQRQRPLPHLPHHRAPGRRRPRPAHARGGSDLAPLAASGPDGRIYLAWTHRASGRARRSAVLRRVL